MSVLQKLTEGIVNRDLQKEGAALLNKWEATGLLEGLEGDSKRNSMARLLENQAKELLREASTMAGGDVEGFAAVAFPIVRRVFGGLIANDLVSVQPMSLPSGLIFFLDFTFGDNRFGESGQTDAMYVYDAGESLYGGNATGFEVTGGVDLSPTSGRNMLRSDTGFYNLQTGYSSPTGSLDVAIDVQTDPSGMTAGARVNDESTTTAFTATEIQISGLTEAMKAQLRYDPDVLNSSTSDYVIALQVCLSAAEMANINTDNLINCNLVDQNGGLMLGDGSALDGASGTQARVIRRLTHLGYPGSNGVSIVAGSKANFISFYVQSDETMNAIANSGLQLEFPYKDAFDGTPSAGSTQAIGAVAGVTEWALENQGVIPEIDIKVDSVSVTAITKKLKAKWSPELGQDLNAYHNLDAEVELTGILSEQIALEIDREILNDLVQGATAGRYYWSRAPGLFVNRTTGAELGAASAAPDFTGTVSEWYETLVETLNDVSAQIHRKTLRGGATFIVCSPEIASILEFTAGFRGAVAVGDDRGSVGAVKVGALSKKWDVYVDPYFPRNLCLIGRNGGSFLESGYVYAPYVPLQVTPTIFGTEDFVPRKGVMTRYAKQMVRADMYGLVIIRGLLGEEGSS